MGFQMVSEKAKSVYEKMKEANQMVNARFNQMERDGVEISDGLRTEMAGLNEVFVEATLWYMKNGGMGKD